VRILTSLIISISLLSAPAYGADSISLPPSWGLSAIEADLAWKSTKGSGVVVAVLDTGVDGTHPDLKGRVLEGFSTIDNKVLSEGANSDLDLHGTHVAGIIAGDLDSSGITGVAPEASILPVRVLGASGGSDKSVADGVLYAVKKKVDVINLSLGGAVNPFSKGGSLTCAAITKAVDAGIVVIVAAGNSAEFGNPRNEPASCKGAVSVAALNESLEPAYFSSFDSSIFVYAPGRKILSSIPVGAFMENYAIWDGTSMAAPFVSGAAALIIASGKAKGLDVVKLLKESAIDVGVKGFDPLTGHGLINLRNVFSQDTVSEKVLLEKIASKSFATINKAVWDGKLVKVNWGALSVGRADSFEVYALINDAWIKKATFPGNLLTGSFSSKDLPTGLRLRTLKGGEYIQSLGYYEIENNSPVKERVYNTKVTALKASWRDDGLLISWRASGEVSDLRLLVNDNNSSFLEYTTVESSKKTFFIPLESSHSARSSKVNVVLSSSLSSKSLYVEPQFYVTIKTLKAGTIYRSVVGSTSNLCFDKKLGCQGALVELIDLKTSRLVGSTRVLESLKYGIDFKFTNEFVGYVLINGFKSNLVKVVI
jgi:hypothetical protein